MLACLTNDPLYYLELLAQVTRELLLAIVVLNILWRCPIQPTEDNPFITLDQNINYIALTKKTWIIFFFFFLLTKS